MNNTNLKEKQTHKGRACSLHGVCGREPLVLSLHEISLFGLEILSATKKI